MPSFSLPLLGLLGLTACVFAQYSTSHPATWYNGWFYRSRSTRSPDWRASWTRSTINNEATAPPQEWGSWTDNSKRVREYTAGTRWGTSSWWQHPTVRPYSHSRYEKQTASPSGYLFQRMKGYTGDHRTINSLLLSGYFERFGLENREYDVNYLEEVLYKLKGEATKSDVDFYYDNMNLFSYTYLTYNGDVASFRALAELAPTTWEEKPIFKDLIKFSVANELSKQILYYLALKLDLSGQGSRSFSSSEQNRLRKTMRMLEYSITGADLEYEQVRRAIDELPRYGDVYQKIYEEEQWIGRKINETLRSI